MAAHVGVDTEKPRTAKSWSRFRDNVPSTDCENDYHRSIAIPVIDNLKITQDEIDPSVYLSEHFNVDTSAEELIKHFGDNLQCKIPTIFRSKLKR